MLINIQDVSLEDIPTIVEIEKRCFPYNYWNDKSFEYAITHMEDVTYRYIFLKATNEDNQIMGYIVATVVANDCEIYNVAVDIPFRKNHIAENLFRQLEFEIYGIASNIYLEVRKSNISALNLYQKLDFQIVGERKNYYDYPRENAILMVKSLC
ncbi:MAG: ribosomal protein S18-alanine N-acetyltransferase [Oscillospiraceae bacterium]